MVKTRIAKCRTCNMYDVMYINKFIARCANKKEAQSLSDRLNRSVIAFPSKEE